MPRGIKLGECNGLQTFGSIKMVRKNNFDYEMTPGYEPLDLKICLQAMKKTTISRGVEKVEEMQRAFQGIISCSQGMRICMFSDNPSGIRQQMRDVLEEQFTAVLNRTIVNDQ